MASGSNTAERLTKGPHEWSPRLTRFAVYGMIWGYSGFALLAIGMVLHPTLPARLVIAITAAYYATGVGLLASLPLRYLSSRLRARMTRRAPIDGGLWDEQLDGLSPETSAKPQL
jgi:hypothetical protein